MKGRCPSPACDARSTRPAAARRAASCGLEVVTPCFVFAQGTTWAERRTGPAACTCTPRCPSGRARAASGNSSGLTFFSTQETSATSTMVSPGLLESVMVDLMFKGTVPKEVSVFLDHVVFKSRDCAFLKTVPRTRDTVPRINCCLNE